jgi:AcrR family transcriptional regulator
MTEIDTSPVAARPQRADARRNRTKVIEAAMAAFAEYGLDAQMDDIARRAGLGVGTLYRHFPTKDALVQALVVDHMTRMAGRGREVLEQAGDPWELVAGFLRWCGEHQMDDRGLGDVLATQPPETFTNAAESSGLVAVADALLRRARDAGQLREDVTVADVPVMMCGLGAVRGRWGQDTGRRYLELMLGGMRAPG